MERKKKHTYRYTDQNTMVFSPFFTVIHYCFAHYCPSKDSRKKTVSAIKPGAGNFINLLYIPGERENYFKYIFIF